MRDAHEMIQQHEEIVALCLRLDAAVKDRLPRNEIYDIMDELISSSIRHFHNEERLMAETGYPEMAQHMAQHRDLLDFTKRFRRQLQLYGEDSFSEWLNKWPLSYFRLHIEHADHPLVEHVRNNATQARL